MYHYNVPSLVKLFLKLHRVNRVSRPVPIIE